MNYERFARTQARYSPPLETTPKPFGFWFFLLSLFNKEI